MRRLVLVGCVLVLSGCAGVQPVRNAQTTPTTPIATAQTTLPTFAAVPTHTDTPARTTIRLPSFTFAVHTVSAETVRYSYHAGCPVAPSELRLVELSYWGFDNKPHVGELVVRDSAVTAIRDALQALFDARFPIRRMQRVDYYDGDDNASMAADNTSAFNCRNAVAPGPPHWSEHAYGEAIDINPIENPYLEGGKVLPPAGAAYVDRSQYKPGMVIRGGVVVRAFARAGWGWGGNFADPDFQHFSATGH